MPLEPRRRDAARCSSWHWPLWASTGFGAWIPLPAGEVVFPDLFQRAQVTTCQTCTEKATWSGLDWQVIHLTLASPREFYVIRAVNLQREIKKSLERLVDGALCDQSPSKSLNSTRSVKGHAHALAPTFCYACSVAATFTKGTHV